MFTLQLLTCWKLKIVHWSIFLFEKLSAHQLLISQKSLRGVFLNFSMENSFSGLVLHDISFETSEIMFCGANQIRCLEAVVAWALRLVNLSTEPKLNSEHYYIFSLLTSKVVNEDCLRNGESTLLSDRTFLRHFCKNEVSEIAKHLLVVLWKVLRFPGKTSLVRYFFMNF